MIPRDRVLEKLDSFLQANDTAAAKRLLKYWLSEAEAERDFHGALLMQNELMGLCRKLGEKNEALNYAENALDLITIMNIEKDVDAATTYLNCATVLKAFDLAEKALNLYQKAKDIYEQKLAPHDDRLAGLYNNMGLALVDLKDFRQAEDLYRKALSVLEAIPEKEAEKAITYLNMATAAETEFGLNEAKDAVEELCKKAMAEMETAKDRMDGNYAFACEKCASVFGFYGYEDYARILKERSRRIYERA